MANTSKKSEEYGKLINTNALIDVNNTTYYIEEDWMETIRKYFNIDSNDAESISMLKTSLFGYNNEIMSNEIKNNVYHRNIIYDEHFLNTASFPESLYNFAKIYNYSINFATPSHCRINFAISKEDLINNKFREEVESETGNVTIKRITYKLILRNDYIFLIDNIPFRLPYPVIINFKETADKSDFSLSAYYDTSDSDFPYLTLTTDYIKLWQEFNNGKKTVFFGLDLFQLSYKEKEVNIVSEDISDNLYFYADFSDQLAYFEVFYNYSGESYKLKTYFNNTYQPDSSEKYCYYTIIDNNQIQISFSSTTGSFRPAINSTLLIKMYTTIGGKGNFSYINNYISVNFNNNGEFDKVPVSIMPITECSGGNDIPTYTETKNGIINKFATRDNLIIDNDLIVFFDTVNKTDVVNGSSIEWIKKRNDTIKRVMNAYLTIRDENKKIIPTNTAPTLLVSSDYFKKNNFSIKENTLIYYIPDKDRYVIASDYSGSVSDKILKYRFPFLLNIQSEPILCGNYFSTYVDKDINMIFQYINPHIDDNFSLKELNIYKDNINSTKYTISVDMNSTYQTVEKDYIIIRCIICDENNNPFGFIDLEPQTNKENSIINKFYFEGYLDINQTNTIINNKLVMKELYNINGGATPDSILTDIQLPNMIKLQLGILLKSSETNYKSGNFANMTDIADYCTAIIYESEESVEFFKNLSNYLESDVITPTEMKTKLNSQYNTLYGNINYYFLKQIPLVEDVYFENCHKTFFSVYNTYLDVCRDSINYLENLTSTDIKLTNTYGKSRFYYYDYTYNSSDNSVSYKYIDNVNLNIDIKIYLNYYITEDVDLAIKSYISDFVEDCNNTALFPISNLITKLESNFDIISYIEFFKIGNINNTQKIKSSFTSLLDMTKEEVADYVPEYINIQKKLDLTSKEYISVSDGKGGTIQVENEDVNKTLTYPYNFDINITYAYN